MNLCSVADVEALVQKTFSGTSNPSSNQLTQWIIDASVRISEETNFQFEETTIASEKHDGNGTPYVMLDHYPITTITSLTIDGSLLIENTNFWVVDSDAGIIECSTPPIARQEESGTGHKNVVVAYKHGKTSVPKSVKEFCATMVALKAINAGSLSGSEGGMLKSYTDGDLSISYSDADKVAVLLLESYRELRKLVPKRVKMEVGAP